MTRHEAKWLLRMAWRDSRTYRRKLLAYMSAIVLGTAALVAVTGLGESLELAIEGQSRSLLGADLQFRSQDALPDSLLSTFADIDGGEAHQVNFGSMAVFPKSGYTRLAAIRAIEGDYPFYGELRTEPESASGEYQNGRYALVDDGLMLQFGAQVGDSIRIGDASFEILGRLTKIPGEAGSASLIGPRVFLPLRYLEDTGLMREGSIAVHLAYLKFNNSADVEPYLEALKPYLKKQRVSWDTVASRQRNLGRALDNLYRFLNLVAFIALLLGSVGVASAVHVYMQQKLNTVAIFHCLGAKTRQTFSIYLLQAALMGGLGAFAGALLGLFVQFALPLVLEDFLPVDVPIAISPWPFVRGFSIGLIVSLLFALLPLLQVRHVSPLRVLRAALEPRSLWRDPLRLATITTLVATVLVFATIQTRSLVVGGAFTGGVIVAFLLLLGTAKGLMVLVKRWFPANWPYASRQGLANLFRPNNQTALMMVAIGLGTFLMANLYLTQQSLLNAVRLTGSANQPNMVMFDIQPDQLDGVTNLVAQQNLPVLQQVPIVTMRLETIKGQHVPTMLTDSTNTIPSWALRREYRCSYRDSLTATEALLSGNIQPSVAGWDDSVFVSLEKGIAENLGVEVGDALDWNVQGVVLKTWVGSIREVDWRRVQPNFFVIFPKGILEDAPQFHVLVTRVPSREASADLQRAVVGQFPNISAIDLTLILDTVDSILDRVAFAIRFMSLFSIFTGLTVLAGAVMSSRFQRIRDNVLLRTLGASRRQLQQILVLEYTFLGLLAALTGLILSLSASWALAYFVFDVGFIPVWQPLLAGILIVTALTIILGLLNNRGVVSRPPLEMLRQEA